MDFRKSGARPPWSRREAHLRFQWTELGDSDPYIDHYLREQSRPDHRPGNTRAIFANPVSRKISRGRAAQESDMDPLSTE